MSERNVCLGQRALEVLCTESVRVCVCGRERDRQRERERARERERVSEREREAHTFSNVGSTVEQFVYTPGTAFARYVG